MSNIVAKLAPIAFNFYVVKRKGKVIKKETRQIRNAAKRVRQERRAA